MSEINTMEVPFYLSAVLISVTCIVYTLIRRRMDKPQNKFFVGMLLALMLNAGTETVCALVEPMGTDSAGVRFVMEACQYLYFVFHAAICPILGFYIIGVTGRLHRLTRRRSLLYLIPFMVTELLMLTNPLNHWSYYYDANMVFTRNWGETVLYLSTVLYFAFVLATFFHSWKVVPAKRRYAIVYFVLLTLGGILIQLLFIRLRVELFAESMAYLGLLLTVENEDDLQDGDTGIYNRKGLRLDVENLLANRQVFHVLCVKIKNPDIIQRITGSSNTELLAALLLKEFTRYVPRYQVYQTAPDTFLLILMEEDGEKALELARVIDRRFREGWSFQNNDILLRATVILVQVPEEMGDSQELLEMADSPLPPEQGKTLYYGEGLGYLLRRRAVENAIQRGLDEGGFDVYYQPTYSLGDRRIHGAEALVRLRDSQLGSVPPDEFIPIAEQIGLINEVDDFVLRSVCSFLAGGLPVRLGLACVNVNLSVLQCIQPGFVERILEEVEASGADRSMLNFEITESVGAEDYEALGEVIRQFHRAGFRVYMDDYGTGYSNIQAIFSMDFDVIKIDKSILWGAQKSRLGMIILENSVRMIRQMDRKILVEGVETAEQIALLEKLGVDYLQGFYFSPPVPRDELVALLLQANTAQS